MSSPLTWFRRYQAQMLVSFGVVLMFSFVIAPSLLDYLDSGAGAGGDLGNGSDVVVTWSEGDVSESELNSMRTMHLLTVGFLDAVVQETQKQGGTPKGSGVRRGMRGEVIDPGIPRNASESQLIRTMLLAHQADELGVVVDEDVINVFLRNLSAEISLDFAALLADSTRRHMSEAQLFNQLEMELKAMEMIQLGFHQAALTPAEMWKFYNRLHRRVSAEVVAVDVARFKEQVDKSPNDEDIQELYDKYKEVYADPGSSDPGFKNRKKASFDYFRVALEPYLEREIEKAKQEITEEEISEHYETNKDRYKKLPEANENPTSVEDAEEAESVTDEPSVEPTSDADLESNDLENNESGAASEEGTLEESEVSAEGVDESSTEAKPVSEAEPSDKLGENDLPNGGQYNKSLQLVVRFQNEEAQVTDKTEPANQPADETSSAAEAGDRDAADQEEPAAPPEEAPAEEAPTEEAASASEGAADPADSTGEDTGGDVPEAVPAENEVDPATEEATGETPEPPVEYRPLDDEIRAEIRDELARQRARQPATEQRDEVIAELKKAMNGYRAKYKKWEVIEKEQEGKAQPKVLDLEALAKQFQIELSQTALVDELEILQHPLGNSFSIGISQLGQMERKYFSANAYSESFVLYEPGQISSQELDVEFVYWKTREEEAFVPELSEIKDKVIDVWKLGEARSLARDQCQKDARAAEESGQTLKEFFAGDAEKVVQDTGLFSWMTRGSVPFGSAGAPTLSEVPGVEYAGSTFMEAVFGLEQGGVTAVLNSPESTCHIVRLDFELIGEEARRDQFIESGMSMEIFSMANEQQRKLFNEWYEELEAELQVEWLRTADAINP